MRRGRRNRENDRGRCNTDARRCIWRRDGGNVAIARPCWNAGGDRGRERPPQPSRGLRLCGRASSARKPAVAALLLARGGIHRPRSQRSSSPPLKTVYAKRRRRSWTFGEESSKHCVHKRGIVIAGLNADFRNALDIA